jgi:predicted transcriptional regulator of viral defense system
MISEFFLATHCIFTRAELRDALPGRVEATLDSLLSRWRRQGKIDRVKRGVFVRLDGQKTGSSSLPDFVALASRMAPDAAVAYHTALEVHGCAQSLFERLTFVTWTGTKAAIYLGRRFVPVRPRIQLKAAGGGEHWIEQAERVGIELRVTSLERTVADVLDRPALAGGIDEVWRSLLAVPALDPDALLDYAELLGSRTLVARLGFFLDRRRDELFVPDTHLERLRARIPRSPVYLDRNRPGRLVSRWALIVPKEIHPDAGGDAG